MSRKSSKNRRCMPPVEVSRERIMKGALASALTTVDELTVALHTPKELLRITRTQRSWLARIKLLSLMSVDLDNQDFFDLPEASDHSNFPHSNIDSSTIAVALEEMEDDDPEFFCAPILGGDKFLSHVLKCPLCLVLCSNLFFGEEDDGVEQAQFLESLGLFLSATQQEMDRGGISIKNTESEEDPLTVHDYFVEKNKPS